jgi:hypothetical protein
MESIDIQFHLLHNTQIKVLVRNNVSDKTNIFTMERFQQFMRGMPGSGGAGGGSSNDNQPLPDCGMCNFFL